MRNLANFASILTLSDTLPRSWWLRQAGLTRLCIESAGAAAVRIALLDFPINRKHPSLANAAIEQESESLVCEQVDHATFIASMLLGRGEGNVLGLCPRCTLVSIPIAHRLLPDGSVEGREIDHLLAEGIVRALDAGADVIQLSLEFVSSSSSAFGATIRAMNTAFFAGVRTVVAAGNRATLGSNPILTANGSVPVVMSDHRGYPHPSSSCGLAIGARGLCAPGVDIPGAVGASGTATQTGSSFAAAFVTAAFALLRSRLPRCSPLDAWAALLRRPSRTQCLIPPSLNADHALCDLSLN